MAATDHEGLEPGARMRTRHMRGSTALSYEPDVVLILDTKSDIVARHHLIYGGGNAEHFKDWSVLSRSRRTAPAAAAPRSSSRSASTRAASTRRPASSREKLVDERVYVE